MSNWRKTFKRENFICFYLHFSYPAVVPHNLWFFDVFFDESYTFLFSRLDEWNAKRKILHSYVIIWALNAEKKRQTNTADKTSNWTCHEYDAQHLNNYSYWKRCITDFATFALTLTFHIKGKTKCWFKWIKSRKVQCDPFIWKHCNFWVKRIIF